MIVKMGVKRPFFSWQYVDCQEVKTTAQQGDIFFTRADFWGGFLTVKKALRKRMKNVLQNVFICV